MGLSNRCLASIVDRAYTAFEPAERHFRVGRVLRAGVPLRPGFTSRPWEDHEGPLRLLVLGGSQGASSLNESVPNVVSLAGIPIELRHQCGKAHVEHVRKLYLSLGHTTVSVEPFIEDMPEALAWADIVISRSGASAIGEICAIGRASILIPYPFAAGDHQAKNAQVLAKAGAAICLDSKIASPESITNELKRMANDKLLLKRMCNAAQRLGRPEAATTIATDIIDLAKHSRSIGRRSKAASSGQPRAEA
jgi:UDP-N-acetylglucosamine--N-acetylmuramyl-(pentapeptide) pyrophosphoryl-undecaprenol N-acetylglucosamine transferase